MAKIVLSAASLFIFIFIVQQVNSWLINQLIIDVQPHEEECFFEYVYPDTRLNFRIKVVEGGFLDIDLKETFPDGSVKIQEKTSEYNDFYHFKENGTYEYCFNNEMSSLTTKAVRIIYYVLHKDEFEDLFLINKPADNSTPDAMLSSLLEKFRSFYFENILLDSRQEIHHSINERTNKWVLWWAVFESLMILGLAFGQVYYIKRFFEVRRMV